MDLYAQVSNDAARLVTQRYSTSFSMACRLYPQPLRAQVYAVYGLVRVADEIVDTYAGPGARELLDGLEADTESALELGYSANIIVHAFARAARAAGITPELTRPFFASMRQDLAQQSYSEDQLGEYIYGSAEVVGLMCLKLFTAAKPEEYEQLLPGARALGAAFQKVNFLRDIGADEQILGRTYFPEVAKSGLNPATKLAIEAGIIADFDAARRAITQLSPAARPAVLLAYAYYRKLFGIIQATPADRLKARRVRLSAPAKAWLFTRAVLTAKASRWGMS